MAMEKPLMEQKEKQAAAERGKRRVWDCGSSLYDSFELKSFERQLDSAIASRTLSMPHLSDRGGAGALIRRPPQVPQKKPSSKISRSLQKLIRSVFKSSKQNNYNNPIWFRMQNHHHQFQQEDGYNNNYVVYDRSAGALTTIPEGPEFDGLSPEIRSLVTRTSSERFTATSIGISCN